MISKSSDIPQVAFSVAAYRFLLAAYPRDFREEYGVHMLQVFRDSCIRVFHRRGIGGVLRLWAVTLFDFVRSVIEEHLQKETNMSKSTLIRIGGWALVLGGLNYLLMFINTYLEETQDILYQLSPFRAFANNYLILLGPIFLLIGLLGLRERYGDTVGNLGKNILLVGAVGALATYLGVITIEGNNLWWIMLYSGPAISLACLTVFGITSLQSKPLPRWNALPIIAGIWYPLAFLLYLTTNIDLSNELVLTYVLLFIQFPALMVLGFILQANVPEQEAAAAV